MKKTTRYIALSAIFFIVVILHIVSTRDASAIFVSSPTKPILPGDITTSEILDNTILDADVSPSADVGGRKIAPRGQIGSVLLSDGTRLATTTAVVVSTSTPVLSVISGRISATSTSFNGVNMSWPSADGTNGQFLQTNGAGTYAYATPGLTMSLTAGQTLAVNDPVGIEPATNAGANISQTTANNNVTFCDNTTYEFDQTFQSATSKLITGVDIQARKVGSPIGNIVIAIVPLLGTGADRNNQVASSTILGTDLTGTLAVYHTNFSPAAWIPANSKMALRIYGDSCAQDAINNFETQSSLTDTYSGGDRAVWNGTVWTPNKDRDMYFVLYDAGTTANSIYISSGAASSSASTTIGFVQSAVATSAAATVLGTGNVISGLRTLTVAATVMLGASGRTLMQTGSIISKALGIMISPTSMLIHIVPW